MTFVTKLRFQSGDRAVLEDLVTDIKELLTRKGAECKGPHASPPSELRVPLSSTLGGADGFDQWRYTVYYRDLEIHGSDEAAARVARMSFPDSVHVEIEVDQKKPLGYRK